MSRENVELVRRVLAQARDNPAAFLEMVHDEAQWETGPGDIAEGPASYVGPVGVSEFFRRWRGAFDDWGFEVREIIDAGDFVVIHLRQWGRGKASGVPVSDDFWQLWRMRDGKLIHRARAPDKTTALEAVGARE